MAVENRLRYSGKITDQFGEDVFQAKVFLSDNDGKPVEYNGDQIATLSDESGNWGLSIPSDLIPDTNINVSSAPFITARYMGEQETIQISRENKTIPFILGAKTQEEEEVTVVGCKTLKCKLKRSWTENKKAYLIGIAGLVLLAVLLTIFMLTRKKNAN